MRKDIFLAVPAAGILFFGAGAMLLALTDRALSHWEIAFWVGVICTPLGLVNVIILSVWEFSDLARRARRPIVGPTILINFATCLLVAGLVWHFSETGALNAIFPGPLAGLTNAQLRERTLTFVQNLRALGEQWEREDRELSERQWMGRRRDWQNLSEDEKTKQFWEHSNKITALQAKFDGEFRRKYSSDAVIIRDELKARVGTLPDPPIDRPIGNAINTVGHTMFDGRLAMGHNGVEAGARLLEFWASRLP